MKNKDEIQSPVVLKPFSRPNDGCIELNADVHDVHEGGIEIDMEEAVVRPSVVIDAVAVVEKEPSFDASPDEVHIAEVVEAEVVDVAQQQPEFASQSIEVADFEEVVQSDVSPHPQTTEVVVVGHDSFEAVVVDGAHDVQEVQEHHASNVTHTLNAHTVDIYAPTPADIVGMVGEVDMTMPNPSDEAGAVEIEMDVETSSAIEVDASEPDSPTPAVVVEDKEEEVQVEVHTSEAEGDADEVEDLPNHLPHSPTTYALPIHELIGHEVVERDDVDGDDKVDTSDDVHADQTVDQTVDQAIDITDIDKMNGADEADDMDKAEVLPTPSVNVMSNSTNNDTNVHNSNAHESNAIDIDIEVDDEPTEFVSATAGGAVLGATSVDIDMTEPTQSHTIDADIDMEDERQTDKAGSAYLQTEVAPSVQQTAPTFAPTATPASSTAPTLDVSSDTIHKTPAWFPSNFAKPVLFLAGSSVLGVWIMQQSINAYFLQTYHKPSPLANIDNGLWKAGAKIHDALLGVKEGANASEAGESVLATPTTNATQAPTSNGASNANGEANTALTTAQAPTQPSKEELIKASLTLNSTHKVLFAGDSLMQGVAPHIQKQLQASGVQSLNLSKQSTGLAYPKFFDWPTTIKNTIAKDKSIKVLVIMLGPNDPWDMPVKGGGQYLKFETPEWNAEYQARMADILNFAKDNQVGVIWVTPPNMKKQKLDTQMMYISNVMAEELARHQVQMLDARPIMGSVNNQYNDYVEKDGKKVKMRTGDGIHFTPDGQRALAQSILSQLHIEPATPANSVASTTPITPTQQ